MLENVDDKTDNVLEKLLLPCTCFIEHNHKKLTITYEKIHNF